VLHAGDCRRRCTHPVHERRALVLNGRHVVCYRPRRTQLRRKTPMANNDVGPDSQDSVSTTVAVPCVDEYSFLSIIADIVQQESGQLSLDGNLLDFGLDSVKYTMLRLQVQEEYQVTLPVFKEKEEYGIARMLSWIQDEQRTHKR
jgi:acyl carrier protein